MWCVYATTFPDPLAQRESGRLTCVRSLVQIQDGSPIGGWCNGSTPDSDSGDEGSNPSSPANLWCAPHVQEIAMQVSQPHQQRSLQAISSVEERAFDTGEVFGSIPEWPTRFWGMVQR